MGLIDSDMNDLKYEIEDESAHRYAHQSDRRGRRRLQRRGPHGGKRAWTGVEFYAMNTDLQALSACQVPNKLQIGAKMTNGLGAGSNPEIGRQAALENTDRIVEMLQGAEMVFVTAGPGRRYGHRRGARGGVDLAKELDALTVAVVTKPFGFEGSRRMRLAEEGLACWHPRWIP